jgi:hypothetical protein
VGRLNGRPGNFGFCAHLPPLAALHHRCSSSPIRPFHRNLFSRLNTDAWLQRLPRLISIACEDADLAFALHAEWWYYLWNQAMLGLLFRMLERSPNSYSLMKSPFVAQRGECVYPPMGILRNPFPPRRLVFPGEALLEIDLDDLYYTSDHKMDCWVKPFS